MKISHTIFRITSFFIIAILFSSCGDKQDERVSRGHLDAIKTQCKDKSDTKLCSREVKKSFIENGHKYVTFENLSKDQIKEVKLNCVPEKEYGLVAYNDCLDKWKLLALKHKLTDPDDEREPTPRGNIEKLKEYTYYIVVGDELSPVATGTGVAIDKNYIATNCHVLWDAEGNKWWGTIWVMNLLDKNKKGRVRLFKEGYKKDIDICILKTETDLKYVKERKKFKKLKQTDFVRALGNPQSIMGHTADGNITAFETWKFDRLGNALITPNKIIHHDATIGMGSSGGPLFDIAGKLVGINSFILTEDVTGGFSMAISADHIKDVLKD